MVAAAGWAFERGRMQGTGDLFKGFKLIGLSQRMAIASPDFT
jgi:hypothetical protein